MFCFTKKNTFFIPLDEFRDVMYELFADVAGFDVDFDAFDGIGFDGVTTDEVHKRLGNHLGVEITSFHTDHADYTGVWVVYKPKGLSDDRKDAILCKAFDWFGEHFEGEELYNILQNHLEMDDEEIADAGFDLVEMLRARGEIE